MQNLFMGVAFAAIIASTGCDKSETQNTPLEITEQSMPLIIADVSLTLEQQREYDERVARAKAIDQFKDPQSYKDAYIEALNYAKTLYPEPHPKLEDLKLEIAFGEFLLGNTNIALKALVDSLPVYIAAGDDYRDRRIEINNNLGVAYSQIGQAEKAIPFLETAIAEWRIKYEGQPHIALGKALDNLAMAHNSMGGSQKALDMNLEALTIIESLPDSKAKNDQLVISIGNRSKYLAESGQTEESIANSLALISRLDELLGPDHPRGAYVLSSLSATLTQMRQFNSAEINARRALDLRETNFGKDKVETAIARTLLISSLLAQSKYEETLPLARYNYDILKAGRGEGAEQTLSASQYLSEALFGVGRVEEALEIQNQNVTFLSQEQTEKSFDRQDATETYLKMLLISGRYKEAAENIDAYTRTAGLDSTEIAFHRFVMMQDLIAANLNVEAFGDVRASENWLDERLATEIFNSGNVGRRNQSLKNSYGYALSAAFRRKDPEDAFRLIQKYNVGAISKARAKRILRQKLSSKKDQDRLATLHGLQERRTRALQNIYRATAKGDIGAVKALSQSLKVIERDVSNLNEVLQGKFRSEDVLNLRGLSQAQNDLDDDTALIMLSDTADGLHMFLMTSDDAYLKTHNIKDAGEIIQAVSAQLKGSEFDKPKGSVFSDLGDLFFDKAAMDRLEGRTNLAVVARGVSAQIPLSVAQLDESGERRWAIEKFAFHYPASLSDLTQHESATFESIDNFIGVGFSQLPSDHVTSMASLNLAYRGVSDLERLRDLPDLPRAGAELRAINESLLPKVSHILADKIFKESDVRALNLKDADVLTFATHGLMANALESYNEAALVISNSSSLENSENDGLLTASEISALDLSADWVVLSACNSGSGSGETTEALSGLATAFTYAGAQSLLVSHWPVRDDAAAFLTVKTVKNNQMGMSKAKALQKAINELRHNKSIADSDNPAIWAPFVLVGN